ncbi:MAG: hypothetical protein U0414_04075 [Polyangiaceae bacterium]
MRNRALSVGLVAALVALTSSRDARADDGPLYALGEMFKDSPTLAIVTSSVVVLADASFTTVDGVAATKRQELGVGFSATEAIVATPQALGFALAPFFFDISRWEPGETLGLLIPFQAWSAALATHGFWSLAPNAVEQPGRVGVSFLVGANWALTTTAFGCLSWGKGSPGALAALEIGFSTPEAVLAIERAVDDPDHGAEWGALSAWSLVILAHGIGSAFTAKRSPDYVEGAAAARAAWAPYFTMKDGAFSLGAHGAF